jgi:hypothetical protein
MNNPVKLNRVVNRKNDMYQPGAFYFEAPRFCSVKTEGRQISIYLPGMDFLDPYLEPPY